MNNKIDTDFNKKLLEVIKNSKNNNNNNNINRYIYQ